MQILVRDIVTVQHRQARVALWFFRRLGQHGEQAPFGGPILFVSLVVVQMLVGDVGDHADIELAAGDTVLGQAVRGGLQHHVG